MNLWRFVNICSLKLKCTLKSFNQPLPLLTQGLQKRHSSGLIFHRSSFFSSWLTSHGKCWDWWEVRNLQPSTCGVPTTCCFGVVENWPLHYLRMQVSHCRFEQVSHMQISKFQRGALVIALQYIWGIGTWVILIASLSMSQLQVPPKKDKKPASTSWVLQARAEKNLPRIIISKMIFEPFVGSTGYISKTDSTTSMFEDVTWCQKNYKNHQTPSDSLTMVQGCTQLSPFRGQLSRRRIFGPGKRPKFEFGPIRVTSKLLRAKDLKSTAWNAKLSKFGLGIVGLVVTKSRFLKMSGHLWLENDWSWALEATKRGSEMPGVGMQCCMPNPQLWLAIKKSLAAGPEPRKQSIAMAFHPKNHPKRKSIW